MPTEKNLQEVAIDDILYLINQKQLVFFLGAAISFDKPSELLGFSQLQNEILDSLYDELTPPFKSVYTPIYQEIKNNEIQSALARKVIDMPPEFLFYTIYQNAFLNDDDILCRLRPLQVFKAGFPNRSHYFLSELLIRGVIPAIFTTNFDTLFESSMMDIQKCNEEDIPNKYWRICDFDKCVKDQVGLYKLHGCIDDPPSIIISLDDIGRRCAEQRYKVLTHYLEKYHMIFMGYRGADLDIYSLLATTNCRGIIWNALSPESLLPKIKRLLLAVDGRVIYGSLFKILDVIQSLLKIPSRPHSRNKAPARLDYRSIIRSWACLIPLISKFEILAEIWQSLGEWQLAFDHFNVVLKMANLRSDFSIEAAVLTNLAHLKYVQGKYNDAEEYCIRLYHVIKKLPSNQQLLELINYYHFKGLLAQKNNISLALQCYNMGIEYVKSLSHLDKEMQYKMAQFYFQIANVNYLKEDYKNASYYYGEAIKIFDQQGNVLARARVLASLGNICHEKRKYDEALYLYNEAKYLFMELKSLYDLPRIYFSMALVNLKKLNINEARSCAVESLKYYEILSDDRGINKASKLLRQINEID